MHQRLRFDYMARRPHELKTGISEGAGSGRNGSQAGFRPTAIEFGDVYLMSGKGRSTEKQAQR